MTEQNNFVTLEGENINLQFETGNTYVVRGTLYFSHNTTIPEDVTLIFQGGKIVSAFGDKITITGNNTRLVAPIYTIFGKDINVEGIWNIDRAYPQWFEDDFVVIQDDKIYNWAIPINKAIKMKRIGEVFLKEGVYEITTSIKATKGIKLIGENSQKPTDSEGVLIKPGSNSNFKDGYMIHINTPYTYDCEGDNCDEDCICKKYPYINYSTMIQNIRFTDWCAIDEAPTQKCILAGGGVHLDNLSWRDFLQAVKYTDTYNDGRCVTNCIFEAGSKEGATSDVYAFDMGFLGDALKFEHNGIANTANGKALRISNCGGATIQSNVINGNILIHQSKAIVFSANHCENGITIEIVDSCVSTQNNYIWKGKDSSYLIYSSGNGDKSVVSLNNDMFIVVNDLLDKNKTLNDLRLQLSHLAEYDISLSKESILNIENVFRYDIGKYGFGKMYSYGIYLQKYSRVYSSYEENIYTESKEDFNEFNKYSYSASCKSQILSNHNLKLQETIKQVNSPNVYCGMLNDGVHWFIPSGKYCYYYQILWDRDRGIQKRLSSESTSSSLYKILRYGYNENNIFTSYDYIDTNENQEGVLIVMDQDLSGNHTMVRLFREYFSADNPTERLKLEYVDVPVCGTQFLYDNGISVCGYKWKEDTDSEQFSKNISDKNIEMFKICDGNVECYTKQENGFSLGSGWKRGDVIHNIGNNPSTYIVPDDIN